MEALSKTVAGLSEFFYSKRRRLRNHWATQQTSTLGKREWFAASLTCADRPHHVPGPSVWGSRERLPQTRCLAVAVRKGDYSAAILWTNVVNVSKLLSCISSGPRRKYVNACNGAP